MHRITHVVSVCTEPVPADSPQSGFTQLRIPIEDVGYHDLLIWFPTAVRFIHQAIKDGGVVLVHSARGISRSATVVAAYGIYILFLPFSSDYLQLCGLNDGMLQRHWILLDLVCFSHLILPLPLKSAVHDQIWPNPGFHEQLVLFELCQYNPSPSNGIYANWRTKIDRHFARRHWM
jgi:dual specificity phosphatase 12